MVDKDKEPFKSGYKTYIIREEIPKEIKRLRNIYDKSGNYNDRLNIAKEIAKLAMSIEDWEKAIEILKSVLSEKALWKHLPKEKKAPILRDLGVSMTKNYLKYYKKFEKGRKYLLKATELNKNDSDAYASLGGTWKGFNNKYAINYYKKALKVNPGDPYPLVNSLILEIQKKNKFKLSKGKLKQINIGIETRNKDIEEWSDLPWPFFDIGTFSLLRGNIEECLNYYLLAIKYSPDDWMIKTTLKTLSLIDNVRNKPREFKFIKLLLLLGIAFHIKSEESKNHKSYTKILKKLEEEGLEVKETNLTDPLIIIAGRTENLNKVKEKELKIIMREAFKNFKCNIICGCPKYGINEIVSDLYRTSSQINALVYVPFNIPITDLGEFSFIHQSNGYEYSILEILQYWFDILNSGIEPNKIKLIGMDGGKLSSLEYRIAIAFGAHVGIITDEKAASSNFLKDMKWEEIVSDKRNQKFYRLYKEVFSSPEEIKSFLESKFVIDLDNESLGALLIGSLKNQTCIYQKDFSIIEIDGDHVVGLTSAIQDFSSELGIGRVPIIPAVKGQLTITDFKDKPIRVIFLLFKKPSDTLIKKIDTFTENLEQRLGKNLLDYAKKFRTYPGGAEMDKLLADTFGSEIL